MILVVMEQWSQAACANCEIFFRNTAVKSENQRKAQSPCRTPEYMVQSIPVQGCPLNPLERQSSCLSAQAGYSRSDKAHTKPMPWPRFKTSVPCTRREGNSFYQGCYNQ